MYRVESFTPVKGDIRKLDKQLQRIIKDKHFANIEKERLRLSYLDEQVPQSIEIATPAFSRIAMTKKRKILGKLNWYLSGGKSESY